MGTLYKVSKVSTIKRDDYELIATTLADGGILRGKNLEKVKYCTAYKPPPYTRFLEKDGVPETHAVLLVGAGRKQGKWYFFFPQLLEEFCCRYNPLGVKLREGNGKVRAPFVYV